MTPPVGRCGKIPFLVLRWAKRTVVGAACMPPGGVPAARGVPGNRQRPAAGSRPRRSGVTVNTRPRFVMHGNYGRRGGMVAARGRFRRPRGVPGNHERSRGGRERPPYNATGWGGHPVNPIPPGTTAGSRPRPTPAGLGAMRSSRIQVPPKTPGRAAYMPPLLIFYPSPPSDVPRGTSGGYFFAQKPFLTLRPVL